MIRRFTGWHMLALMLGFFGLIIAVNVTMASIAVGTFGGTVVDNSYVASQRYNGWLKAAADQKALGWRVAARVDEGGRLHIAASDAAGRKLAGRMIVIARHPLGRVPDQRMTLRQATTDHVADQPLPGGRWLLHIELAAGGQKARFVEEVRA